MRAHRTIVLTLVFLMTLVPTGHGWWLMGDMNLDGAMDVFDIDAFVECLVNGRGGHANPIDYWPLDGLTRDYGAYVNHGVEVNDPNYSADVPPAVGIGWSMNFDGVGDYIYLGPGLLGGDQSDEFTLDLWFKTSAIPDQSYACLFGNETTDGEFAVYLLPDGSLGATVYVEGGDVCNLVGPAVNDGMWHQVVLRKSASDVALILDNHIVDSCSASGPVRVNGLWHATIGCKYTDDPDYFYEGLIDEVKIHDRALSDAEIGVIFPPTGPVNIGRHVASLCVRPGTSELYVGYYLADYLTVIDMDTLTWYDTCTVG
ncbi:MAG: LamG domain-containing protein, partial [Phycisphaerae bacterium]|nr:LamG domain-containing protein [Phycisphaerae bacterium]